MPLAQTHEQLIAGAKKEGKLVIYASATAPQLQMYFAAFNKSYPFIKTEFFRTGKQKLVTVFFLEEQAKQRIADVIHTSVIETNILKKRGALSRYVPMEVGVLPGQYKDPEGFWTSAYASGTLLGFNSRQVKRAEAPKNYDDLLNPRWKNAIAIDSNKIEWFAMLLKLKGRAFMEKLAAQNPTVSAGNTICCNCSPPASFAITAGVYEYSVEDLKTKGAPVDWIGLEPVITYTVAVSLPSQPPHPFAAKLFIEWLLSKEGQEVDQPIWPRADPRRRRLEVRQDSQTTQTTDDRRRSGPEEKSKSTKLSANCSGEFVCALCVLCGQTPAGSEPRTVPTDLLRELRALCGD